jgi:hypothetical protein
VSRPRGQHMQLLPGMPRHLPSCTKRRRAEEGCECSISYYYDAPLPTARQWRARRRRTSRTWHRWDMTEKRHGIPPQHNHQTLATSPGLLRRLPCPDGCPAKGFVYARDWPPTVTSWRGLL